MKKTKITNPVSGAKILNLAGERFSRLVVIELDIDRTKIEKKIYWKCLCDCGDVITASRNSLIQGNIKSCGCLKSDTARYKKFSDITGNKYGRLVVEEFAYFKNKKSFWKCKCECGNNKIIGRGDLISGKTISCGCLLREISSKRRTPDLTNKVFGKLLVIKMTRRDSKGTGIWLCRCECGTEIERSYVSLMRGDTISCGCERVRKLAIKTYGDMINCKFGKLTVLEVIPPSPDKTVKRKRTLVKCHCDCGADFVTYAYSVKNGNAKSCGCSKIDAIYSNSEDLSNQRFGNLIAIERVYDIESSCNTKSGWNCMCDCGNSKIVITHHLKAGLVKSCGCRECSKGVNNSNWKGGLTPLYIFIRQAIEEWRKKSFEYYDYTCDISNKRGGDLVVHHLIPFKDIVAEVMKELNLNIFETMELYSEKERKMIAEKSLELHFKYGLGVVLCRNIHNLFHSLYGKHNNSKEEFYEFKRRYLNKEFESIMVMEKDCP